MKEKLISVLKVLIPLGIGVYVIWYQYNQLTDQQIAEIKGSFASADYFWVGLSVTLGLFSHLSRAYRWKYTLEPLGYRTRFMNNLFGVMIGYVANIVLPRFGEVWRCVLVARYEKLAFEKVFGTVVAERVADMVMLMIIILTVVVMEFSKLSGSVTELVNGYLTTNSIHALLTKVGILLVVLTILTVVLWQLVKRSDHPVFGKVRGLVKGLMDGILSIMKMKQKWAFLGHTIFIWAVYLAMYYVPFLALPETAGAPLGAVLASFVMASFSIVLVQGGIGVYPVAVAQTLVLYGISYESGFAMGWIIWVAQTLMLVFWGVLSLIAMPIYNAKLGANPSE